MVTYDVHVGPQHPASGQFRYIVTLDGDTIVSVKPDLGYVHRGTEKICEHRTFSKIIPLIERTTMSDASHCGLSWVRTLEEAMGVKPPLRARYIRSIICEMNRITSHLYWFGLYGVFLGHTTPFLWCFGDREPFIDLCEEISGQRLTYSTAIPGGVRFDLPEGFEKRAHAACDYFETRLKEYKNIFLRNPAIRLRTENIGILSRTEAIEAGATGPSLRASGIASDVRKDEPYDAYPYVDFDVITREDGDCMARILVHYEEMKQSMKIIRQCVDNIPEGEIKTRAPPVVKPGEYLGRIEGSRGEMGVYLRVTEKNKLGPYRVKIINPSFRNVAVMPLLFPGYKYADACSIYWSLDYWPVGADR
ncbi:MAG: NADH-quinone oxidoreductase subunit D [Candidatus Ranarchaeia archaeon]